MTRPSKVFHIRNVGHEISKNDLLQLVQPFGVVTKLVMLRAKNQALLQMHDVASAVNALQFFTNVQPFVRGRNVYFQFSSHQELTKMDQSGQVRKSGDQDSQPNQILLVTIHHLLYPITVEELHRVFSPHGFVEKIVTFQKSAGSGALIQYQSRQSALQARNALQGRNIYDGCCQLDIQFSNLNELQVNYNNERSRDFTNPSLPSEQKGRSPQAQLGGSACAENLLDDQLVGRIPPFVERLMNTLGLSSPPRDWSEGPEASGSLSYEQPEGLDSPGSSLHEHPESSTTSGGSPHELPEGLGASDSEFEEWPASSMVSGCQLNEQPESAVVPGSPLHKQLETADHLCNVSCEQPPDFVASGGRLLVRAKDSSGALDALVDLRVYWGEEGGVVEPFVAEDYGKATAEDHMLSDQFVELVKDGAFAPPLSGVPDPELVCLYPEVGVWFDQFAKIYNHLQPRPNAECPEAKSALAWAEMGVAYSRLVEVVSSGRELGMYGVKDVRRMISHCMGWGFPMEMARAFLRVSREVKVSSLIGEINAAVAWKNDDEAMFAHKDLIVRRVKEKSAAVSNWEESIRELERKLEEARQAKSQSEAELQVRQLVLQVLGEREAARDLVTQQFSELKRKLEDLMEAYGD